jgi:hypothetical protein
MSNLESESSLSDQQQDDAVETKRCFDGEIEYLHEWVPIFFTASWMVRIRVNGKILFESEGRDEPWDEDDKARWVRAIIGANTHLLISERIDANKEYETWGGYRF